MMPAHCKDVAFKRVDFPLTAGEVLKRLPGLEVFTRTDYFILENRGRYAVVGVKKKRGIELFRKVEEIDIISLPETTEFVDDPECDVLNHHAMARKAAGAARDTVVVLGKFSHISFIKKGTDARRINVVDFIPPSPSKTLALVEDALRTGAVKTPLIIEPVLVDALSRLPDRDGITVMFPCEAGKLTIKGKPVLYLDKTPPLPKDADVVLAGCKLSEKIFRHIYGRSPEFVNICPRDIALGSRTEGELAVARCCDVHKVKVENGLALVPYGATLDDVVLALRTLVGEK